MSGQKDKARIALLYLRNHVNGTADPKRARQACYELREFIDMAEVTQPAEQQPVSWIRIRGDHVILSRCDWMYPASTEDSAGPRDEQRFAAIGRRDGDIVLPAPEGALDREDLKTMLAWPSASKPAEQQPAPAVQREPSLVAWVLFDATSDQKYIKKSELDDSFALFDSEAAAQRAKRANPGTDYTRCEYYSSPQPAPDVAALVEALDLALYWRDRQQRYTNRRPRWVIAAESALAAHRKGE